MKNKDERIVELSRLIDSNFVSSQEEIMCLMAERGFKITQSTLSRDLRTLKVYKTVLQNGEYRYLLPPPDKRSHRSSAIADSGFVSLDFSGNIAVVRTRPGYASRLAYEIDEKASEEVIGTVAGEDTILLVISENSTREKVKEVLSKFIDKLK